MAEVVMFGKDTDRLVAVILAAYMLSDLSSHAKKDFHPSSVVWHGISGLV